MLCAVGCAGGISNRYKTPVGGHRRNKTTKKKKTKKEKKESSRKRAVKRVRAIKRLENLLAFLSCR